MSTFHARFKKKGVREPLTNRIAGILDEYPDGTQIARELLQNSDDARSKIQWYLLDHRHHIHQRQTDANQVEDLKIFHPALAEYMGPALLAGSDSVFEEKDFKSMKNLAASEKKTDETKIGQMGIGFNSIYHMTDCPSFITADQLVIIEPHERVFNGINSDYIEGTAHGDFVEDEFGLQNFPDQLRTFCVLENIDFSKPYPGTIFRFPLRTEDQAKTSRLSGNAYPADKVMDMLVKLKDEALRGILFLKHIERIEIYELKDEKDGPKLLFKIEIVNAEEVRQKRQDLLANLRDHVYPDSSASTEAILDYSIRPVFRLTQEDGTSTEETWHIATLVSNVITAHEYMQKETKGDLSKHKLIPWVGIAAPAEPGKKIGSSRLFCFLPIGIELPFPVHINGHFAVKQSRREIWTNQENDFANNSTANIKSVWNVHLFERHIPEVYAMFLNTLGLARGKSYDLWPLSDGTGVGIDLVWKDLLKNTLHVVCKDNLRVFFCRKDEASDLRAVNYTESWIAGRDLDEYPLLLEALQTLDNVVINLPDPILELLPGVVKSLESLESLELEDRILTPELVRKLLRNNKIKWSDVVSSDTKIEMLKYCIQDGGIADLEGLPLLPLAGDQWVEFCISASSSRFLVPLPVFKALSYSNDGLVDINIDSTLVDKFKRNTSFEVYWSTLGASSIASRVKDVYQQRCYQCTARGSRPVDSIQQQPDAFPSNEWIDDFWNMTRYLPLSDRRALLSQMEGIHVVPITRYRLAPLSTKLQVVYLDSMRESTEPSLREFLNILEDQLEYRVLRQGSFITEDIAKDYVFEISDAVKVLRVIGNLKKGKLNDLDQPLRQVLCNYVETWLSIDPQLDDVCLQTLKSLPVYIKYESSDLVPLQDPESKGNTLKWKVASGFKREKNPWLPISVGLLKDEQKMRQHLVKTIKIPTIKESEYWYNIMSELERHPEAKWDSMMEKFCMMYNVHSKDYDFISVMQDLKFVRTEGPRPSGQNVDQKRLSPRSVVHTDLSKYYMSHESVFPSGVYSQPHVLIMLSEMGMESDFDASLILDRIRALSNRRQSPIQGRNGDRDNSGGIDDDHHGALRALYARMNADFSPKFSTQKMKTDLRSVTWILAKSSDEKLRLYSAQECRRESDVNLIGNQMPLSTFGFNNKDLIHCMGWDQPPPLNAVLVHFLTMIKRFKTEPISDKDTYTFYEIYCYLLEKIANRSDLSTMKRMLADQPWILINGMLHTTDRVALKLTCNLAPHFVQITTSDSRLNQLFVTMGVREKVDQADLEGLISAVKSRYGEGEVSKEDVDFVVRILQGMTAPNVEFQPSPNLLVPTADNTLCKVRDVVYDDVGAQTDRSSRWTIESTDGDDKGPSYKFVSDRISKVLADTLGVMMLSARCWEEQKDSTFEPWSQEENILDRIANILNDYDPSSIFTEFVQNAADAGASKCCFMLDTRKYPGHQDTMLSKKMIPWQGPAIVIYNNAKFSESDFKALSKLGVGNKRDDSSKIGRHGLGFNSVYHFTDVPSVVSGDHIVFFDPQRKYLPTRQGEVAQGGHRYSFVNLKKDVLSDQLAPYKGLFGCDMETHFEGTIFRIPLRTLDVQHSSEDTTIGQVWTLQSIQSMFRQWAEDTKNGYAKTVLVFLDELNVIEIDDNVFFKWSATKEVESVTSQSDDTLNEHQHQPASTRIINIRTSTSTESVKWLVHTEHDLPSETPSYARAIATKNGWKADRGIAFPLNFNYKAFPFYGRIFTHLPTPILTGLPFHINGAFALTSNRKGLAGGSDDVDPKLWNQFVMETALPLTAANALEKLLQYMFRPESRGGPKHKEVGTAIEQYFRFWPFKPKTDGFQGQNGVGIFTKTFICLSHKRPIFPCKAAHGLSPPVKSVEGQDVVFTGTLLKNAPGNFGQTIRGQLRSIGINMCDCPGDMQVQIKRYWSEPVSTTLEHQTNDDSVQPTVLDYQQIDDDMIRLICQDPTFISQTIKNDDEKRWILGITLRVLLDTKAFAAMKTPLTGLALIPLRNGEWKELQFKSPSSPEYYIAQPEITDLIKGDDLLVNETLFKTVKDQRQGDKSAPNLEGILDRLVHNTDYCIKEMSPEVLAARICAENPLGVSSVLRDKIWRHLNSYQDLSPFYALPILKTLDERMLPLKSAVEGLELSSVEDANFRRSVRDISTLLTELGIVVFDATENNRHPFLTTSVSKANRAAVLKAITACCSTSWPLGRALKEDEASMLRNMISSSQVGEIQPFVAKLGCLPIWISWAPPSDKGPTFICARGSYYLDVNYNFDWTVMGDNSDMIRYQNNNCMHLSLMGAKTITLIHLVDGRIIPRFLNGTLTCTGATKSAYIGIFREIIKRATPNGRKTRSTAAKEILRTKRFILARDGTMRNGATLFGAHDVLCSTIFGDKLSMFPDPSVWDLIWPGNTHLFTFRDSKDAVVVKECADRVLEMTQGKTQLPPESAMVRTKAVAMVDFIYKNENKINWMDPRWKIVPTEITTTSPHNEWAPDLPLYQSFGEVMEKSWHDLVWTQCAFFPDELKPPQAFKNRFPNFGQPNVNYIVEHLRVLTADVAFEWTSVDLQRIFRSVIFEVYRTLNQVAIQSRKHLTELLDDLEDPFILNGDLVDSSDRDSWLWPRQLMLDIENNIGQFRIVPDKLQGYREFLVAAGVMQMKAIEGMVEVPSGRKANDIEARLLNCFEAQDQRMGFMDVRFEIADGREIMAHKFVLVHSNEFFSRMFTGSWAERTAQEPFTAGRDESYEAVYGLLYYFYTDCLIATNGPPLLPSEDSPRTDTATNSDELRDRVEYLMELLLLSNRYEAPRLKKLIAYEIVVHQKVIHGNVFSVRAYAMERQSSDIQNHCEEYIKKNAPSVRTYLDGELEEQRKLLSQLTGDSDGAQRGEIRREIEELESNIDVFEELLQ